jgi:hypothetical protein
MVTEEQAENVVSYFATHLVSLSCVEKAPKGVASIEAIPGLGTPHFLSAFLIDVSGQWVLVTAGHILKGIEDKLANGYEFSQWTLHDALSNTSIHQNSIPFPFDWAAKGHCNSDDGADFGLVALSPVIRANLEANGKRAITRQAWEQDMPSEFEGYLMLGLPSQFQGVRHLGSSATIVEITPTVIPVIRLHDPPEEFVSEFPRFYARLHDPLVDAKGIILESIDGMSGGPIFGYQRIGHETRYWALAIQSGWFAQSRIITACWLRPLAASLARAIAEFS